LAYERYQRTRDWNGLEGDSVFARRFQEHRRDLPEPDRLLAEAESDTGGIRRSIASHRRVVERFPDFWWGVFSYADQLDHWGPLVGYDVSERKRWLEQTLELNPRFLPGWEHVIWVSAEDGDTVRIARAVAALERLNAGPELRQGYGYDIMPMYRLILEAWRRKGRPAPALLDTVAKELATRSSLVSGEGRSGLLTLCGLPALEIEIDRRVPALDPDSQTLIWSRRSLAHAWAARGAWDSALTAAVGNARAAGTAADSRVALRLAITGAWVGAVSWDEVKRIRESIPAFAHPASPGERTEIAWLDGVAAVGRNDRAALNQALIAVRDTADPDADRLAGSLELLGRAKAGGRGTADSLALLAEDGADRPWDFSTDHPLFGALLNLEAGRLLLEHGDTTRAIRLLVWPAAAIWSHVARLSWALAGLANLERGRVAEAQGHREEALHLYNEFLRRYDMPVAAHRHLVTEAEGAVRRLEGRRE
jgi:tetratricopeptide (TPR) repeat protein